MKNSTTNRINDGTAFYERLFHDALLIRRVEEVIIDLYPSDQIQSPVHLSIGQEAVAVGFCKWLEVEDWLFINYRGHAFYIARHAPLGPFFAELMGRAGGICNGKGGSMHLAAPDFGVMGASAVVGSTISHAVGAALASKMRGENRVFVAVFGDGALEQGVIHETMNFAALHQLNVVFLCENNGLAVHANLSERQSFSACDLARTYKIQYCKVDQGYDMLAVSGASKRIIESVKTLGGPAFLEVKTARYKEHVGPGEDFDSGYRSSREIDDWKSKDPLLNDATLLEKYNPIVNKKIDAALDWAMSKPFPTIKDLLTDVY